MLPSNISQEGENPYEQPFTNETLPSGISLAGTLPSTGSSIDPYAAFSSDGSKSPLEKKVSSFSEKNLCLYFYFRMFLLAKVSRSTKYLSRVILP